MLTHTAGVVAGLAIAAVGVLAAGDHQARSGARPLTIEDLAAVPQLGGAVLSPDGARIATVRDGQIVLLPAQGGSPETLTTTAGGKSSPDWSPDGASIAYASQGNIWVVPAAGGPPRRLTDSRPGSGDPRTSADRQPQWSPDGRWVLFESGRRGNGDVYVVSADGDTVQAITTGDADEGSAVWSPDGRRIAYVARSPEYFSGRLSVVEVSPETGRAVGTPRVLHEAPADRGGGWSIGRPSWSPDGSQLAVVLQQDGWDHVYLVPVAGGPPKAITSGEWEDGSPVFSPDGRTIAIVSNRANLEEQHVWLVDVRGGEARRLASPVVGVESNPQWAADGRRVFFTRSTPLEPTGIFVADARAGGNATPVLRQRLLNFQAAGPVVPAELAVTGPDGVQTTALVYTPRSLARDAKAPTLLWIHGGPEGQDTFAFDPWAQLLTTRGYVVVKPNYRGSSGYGERFRNLNVEDSGGGELQDVIAVARAVVASGLADPERLAIGGGSHGGTMVAYAITKEPALFKAALELYGVVDRASYNERTNRNAAIRWMRKMGGTPTEKPDVYRKANVLPDVPRITAPVLVMHGEADPQVPPYESAQLVAALKKAGKPHVYVTYPNEGHGFQQRDHRIDAWRKQIAFLDRYLQPPYGLSLTSTQEIVLDDTP